MPAICTSLLAKLFAYRFLYVLLLLVSVPSLAQVQSLPYVIVSPPIKWNRQTGVTRYRLQIATDARFQNVLLDRLVHADEYHPSDLSPGYYYWRVAPSEYATGTFLPPSAFRVIAGTRKLASSPEAIERRPSLLSWFTATGPVKALLAAPSGDFIAINEANVVYAIDPSDGIPRWVTRVQGNEWGSTGSFRPIFASGAHTESLLLFAIGSQLRAMDIQTGTQSWSTELKGRPVAGVLDPSGVGVDANRIYVIDSQNRFYAIDGETGDIRKEEKLRAHPTGQLSLLPGRGVLVATTDQALELRGLNGRFLKKIQINAGVTTAPVVVKTRRGSLLIVGTRQGLAGFDAATLRPLGLLTLDNGDYPVFGPVTAELDNDEDAELLIITSRGSVAAVDSDLGRLKWIVRVGTGADSLSVVDMDGDGRSDVVIPGNTGSVMALSSLDGSVIWEAEQQSIRESVDSRLLVTQKSKAGRLLLAVRRSSGIAAIELMPGSRR